ncbi:MAG TPA: metallophosphoesterase [Gemmatimonadales bacterium]|nr:metallophosphoesterase [Gemmatimonadales bacterium]
MSSQVSRRRFLAAAGVGLVGMSGGAGYAFGVEPRHVLMSPEEVPVPGLPPALDGLRILQVSDIHLYAGLHAPARRAMAIAAEAAPDITLLTGDLLEQQSQLPNLKPLIEACRGRLATVAVMGNWEYAAGVIPSRYARALEAGGAELLYNAARVVSVGDTRLALVGLDDPRAGYPRPDKALADVPAGIPTVWTYHAPGYTDDLSPDRYPPPTFIAAGHTHGGQIRFPLVPPVLPPGSGRFVAGWYRDTFAPLYVSRGIGTTAVRARFLCPPELPLFTLRRT